MMAPKKIGFTNYRIRVFRGDTERVKFVALQAIRWMHHCGYEAPAPEEFNANEFIAGNNVHCYFRNTYFIPGSSDWDAYVSYRPGSSDESYDFISLRIPDDAWEFRTMQEWANYQSRAKSPNFRYPTIPEDWIIEQERTL